MRLLKTRTFLTALLAVLSFSVITSSSADHIKRSKSGICHSPSSRYYNRIKTFESFHSLAECIDPDKRTSNTNDEQVPRYERGFFGHSWADVDRDCQNTRAEELINQSTGTVYFGDAQSCRVVKGRWLSLFTGEIITDASKTDIDHVVPLKFAWTHGAHKWPIEKRKKFANDPINLIVVESSLNRAKGAKGPTEWLPLINRCEYTLKFLRIMKIYKLELSKTEISEYTRLRENVCGN